MIIVTGEFIYYEVNMNNNKPVTTKKKSTPKPKSIDTIKTRIIRDPATKVVVDRKKLNPPL